MRVSSRRAHRRVNTSSNNNEHNNRQDVLACSVLAVTFAAILALMCPGGEMVLREYYKSQQASTSIIIYILFLEYYEYINCVVWIQQDIILTFLLGKKRSWLFDSAEHVTNQ